MSTSSASTRHLNRLAKAKSPYLLQHAENPVDWYEWGQEAFDKAKEENKPIFLSVGYSACHWCHVLAHESFEDEITAKMMNEHYVNVKVDREERPDVDRLYMTFLQASTGGGGWPMSVWLTPDLHPFFAGTYFPPGRFRQVLERLADVWADDRERCIESAGKVLEALKESSNIAPTPQDNVDLNTASQEVFQRLQKRFDVVNGGFGGAPKFPSPAQTTHFLARYAASHLSHLNASSEDKKNAQAARDVAVYSMVKIYNGGIRDVVGGGFSRYSVDERWHVPHFEKMLYDEAQLLLSSLDLYQLLPTPSRDRKTLELMAKDIVSYVANDLRSPEGGFYSAEDADSLQTHNSTVKKEGAFYVWTSEQLDELLGADADLFKYHFGVEADGNCDPGHDIQGELKGQNVLYSAHTPEETAEKFNKSVEETEKILNTSLKTLRDYRDKHRPRPHLDDKILTCWNGLMISGLARASEVLKHDNDVAPKALEMAEASAAFIRNHLFDEQSGKLWRSYREGPGPTGQADDYAFLIQGLLDLYEASANEEHLLWAIRLQEKQDELFYDPEDGGYFASAPDEHILIRMKDAQDGAEPSAVSVTLANLQRLAHLAEDRHADYNAKAKSILSSNGQLLTRAPFALASMVSAAMMADKGYMQFIHTGASSTSPLLELIRSTFIPNRVLIHIDPKNPPRELAKVNGSVRSLIEELDRTGGETVENVRICEDFTCGLPIEDVDDLRARLPLIVEA
ncbi:Spermatogenesis-associated protein 20 [Trametes pubescens]|uniref:Spermatogenesis-associated protein 20 n=1 Tax=Trametes pubescens TaxID=154538 RepID=A0A1M2W737_TRAPU|nr:Spermatogenesis-associated protein 20 [Trametes pubescens]